MSKAECRCGSKKPVMYCEECVTIMLRKVEEAVKYAYENPRADNYVNYTRIRRMRAIIDRMRRPKLLDRVLNFLGRR